MLDVYLTLKFSVLTFEVLETAEALLPLASVGVEVYRLEYPKKVYDTNMQSHLADGTMPFLCTSS